MFTYMFALCLLRPCNFTCCFVASFHAILCHAIKHVYHYRGPFQVVIVEVHFWKIGKKIKGPDNPTSQLLPIMSQKCCSGDREGRKDKGGGGGKMVWQSCVWKMMCERWCAKDGVWQSCVWKMVCERWCVTELCVKDCVCVWQSSVWKMVYQRWWVTKLCVWKMVCKIWCVKAGVWKMVWEVELWWVVMW